jgi:Uma2 family endonuclease
MSMATQTAMTTDEFVRLHGDESGVELLDGQIRRLPMPGCDHGQVCFKVALVLGNFVMANNLGRMMTNDSFVRITERNCFGADVMFVSYATLPADQPIPAGPITPPVDLVVEVRSPSDTIGDMSRKAHTYLDAGVRVVLVLDPEHDTAGVYLPDELPQRFHNGDELRLPDVLPGFAVPVGRFFE